MTGWTMPGHLAGSETTHTGGSTGALPQVAGQAQGFGDTSRASMARAAISGVPGGGRKVTRTCTISFVGHSASA
jgi:hypothetical protein